MRALASLSPAYWLSPSPYPCHVPTCPSKQEVKRYDWSAPEAINIAAGVGHFTALVWRGSSSFGCGVGRSAMQLPGLPGVTAGCKVVVCR